MRAITLTVAAAGCTALLLAGCSDASSTSSEDPTTGPLSAYFERISGGYEEQDWDAMNRQMEEVTAACMREAGFEYTPQDYTGTTTVVTEEAGAEYGTEEYAAKNGYGITTSIGATADPDAEEWVDANADYVAGMSETEQAAYYEALYGEQSTTDVEDPEAEATEYDWTTAGCQGKASHEVYETGTAQEAWEDPAFADLQEQIQALYEQSSTAPQFTEINTAWSDCMSEAGYDFATVNDASMSISDASNALWENVQDESGPDPAALEELKTKEIATAVADARCQKSTDYQKRYQKAWNALEQDFVDQHKDELEAWVAAHATDEADK
ncbi:hypothetical protein ACGIF2_16995 [Cellulomonas sp. P22]|uniref:hypothetical protein n=1 Tax=Cellulomonas sp. P22 TaxID=3373189 RepID=UPI0037A7F8AE